MIKQVRFFALSDDGYKASGRAVLRDGVMTFEGFTKLDLNPEMASVAAPMSLSEPVEK